MLLYICETGAQAFAKIVELQKKHKGKLESSKARYNNSFEPIEAQIHDLAEGEWINAFIIRDSHSEVVAKVGYLEKEPYMSKSQVEEFVCEHKDKPDVSSIILIDAKHAYQEIQHMQEIYGGKITHESSFYELFKDAPNYQYVKGVSSKWESIYCFILEDDVKGEICRIGYISATPDTECGLPVKYITGDNIYMWLKLLVCAIPGAVLVGYLTYLISYPFVTMWNISMYTWGGEFEFTSGRLGCFIGGSMAIIVFAIELFFAIYYMFTDRR